MHETHALISRQFFRCKLDHPSGGCRNGTLTFVALTLRSAEEIAARFRTA